MTIHHPKKKPRVRRVPVRKPENRLERRLRELEHLAESLAHDLKAPGERVRDLAVLFRKEYESRLDERANRWLQLLQRNGEDLVERVNGLLEIAAIGGPRKAVESVAPILVLRQVLETWGGEIRSRRAQVQIGKEFRLVACHYAALRQIFDNLISNAIKYSGDRPDFEIHISSECSRGRLHIAVADNGRGIPTSQHERVFEPFVRLSPDSGGQGIGLSIVKRLVESYGGRTWIESNRGGGCTVHFTLPVGDASAEARSKAGKP